MPSIDALAAEWAGLQARVAAAPSESAAGRRRARWGVQDDAGPILGSTTPRVWTPPAVTGEPGACGCGCALDRETSLGFAVTDFATRIGRPLDPWQRWLVIHAMELWPNGWPRFRQVIVLVARQNGKTELLVILSLFWMWVQRVPLVLGTSTKLDYSRESWMKALKLIKASPDLLPAISDRDSVRKANGEQEITARFDGGAVEARYKIAAANPEGGRSLTVHRLIEDELRQHHDYSAHAAAENAMNAVDDAQAWAITNEGDDRSIVLHELYDAAVDFIEGRGGDERLGLFAWSAPDGCAIDDPEALAAANPNLNRRGLRIENMIGKARTAAATRGELEARFRVEVLCQRVPSLQASELDVERFARLVSDERPEGQPVFFVAVAGALKRSVIAVAAMRGGIPHVELADDLEGVAGVPGRLVELAERYPQARFAMSAASPARKSLDPLLQAAGIEMEYHTVTDVASGCAHLQALILDDGLTFSGDEAIVTSMRAAVMRKLDGGAWIWDWERSVGLAPAAATSGALWLLEVAHRNPVVLPQIF